MSSLVIAVVPCKGSSRRVPAKNKQVVGGLPLWLRKARQLDRLRSVDAVYIDTDDSQIACMARKHALGVIKRPEEVNEFDGNEMFAWEVSRLPEADVYVQALCTAPFLGDEAIEGCISGVLGGERCVSVSEYRHDYRAGAYVDAIPDSHELGEFERDCMSLYAVSGEYARSTGLRTSRDAVTAEVSAEEALDIDYVEDLRHAQLIADGMKARESREFASLARVLSSALICDVLSELGAQDYEMRFGRCPDEKKLGRACTVKLVAQDSDERTGTIYDALETYEWCSHGDMIVVDTDSHDEAYFGELNSLLAERSGAVGCVVEFTSRDKSDTVIPVWCDDHRPSDCREVLALGGIGVPIEVCGVIIEHGDLIMADADGCVRIPWEIEDKVLHESVKRARNESSIRFGVAIGEDVEDILESAGRF